ncbi:MAG TPA: MFS transporter [Steroidobacteraceae bacterium]|jgi:AAHS family 3-hydroxyphenylpropionic acid transporter
MANSSSSKVGIGIAFCALCALCEGIDLQAAGVAAPGIVAELHPTANLMGPFFSSSTIGLFLGALIGGRISDSLGRRGVLILSVALFGVCSLLNAIAWDMPSLIAFRLLTGLGLGGALPMVLAYVSETASPRWQRATLTAIYALMPFGGAIISLISFMVPASGWRTLFVVGGIIPLVLAPLMWWRLPESSGFRQSQVESGMPRRGSFAAVFADGRATRTTLLWMSFFLELLLLYALLNWLPTLLLARGATRAQAGIAQIGFNLGGVVAAPAMGLALGGRLKNPAIVAMFVAIPVLLVLLAKGNADPGMTTLTVFLLGCAILAAQAYLYASAPSIYPVTIRGVGVGAAVAAGRLGSIVGPQLAGMLKAAGHDTPHLLMDLLPIVIIGSIAALSFAWIARDGSRKSH